MTPAPLLKLYQYKNNLKIKVINFSKICHKNEYISFSTLIYFKIGMISTIFFTCLVNKKQYLLVSPPIHSNLKQRILQNYCKFISDINTANYYYEFDSSIAKLSHSKLKSIIYPHF